MEPSAIRNHTQQIKTEAARLGFDFCGIAKAEFLSEDARRLESWLNQSMHGKMHYMENWFDKRVDPRKLVSNAKSVVSLMLNYFPEQQQPKDFPKISKYAFGKDYHLVIKDKLKELLAFIDENIGEVKGRAFVDSAPVLERTWAQKTGLGWIGKNGMLINKTAGSYFFLAELILDIELSYDSAMINDHCGTCTKCIDACPTDAILPNKIVDGSKCISYFTIELKDEIPHEFKNKMDGWAFGCDVCQDTCPWNRFSKPNGVPEFNAVAEQLNLTARDWIELTDEVFNKLFKDSPIKRTKLAGMKRNVSFLFPTE